MMQGDPGAMIGSRSSTRVEALLNRFDDTADNPNLAVPSQTLGAALSDYRKLKRIADERGEE